MSLWKVLVPEATTNLIQNPSFEQPGTNPMFRWVSANLSAYVRNTNNPPFGVYNVRLTPTADPWAGIFTTIALTNGIMYTFSAYVLGAVGVPYSLYFTDNAGSLVGTRTNVVGIGAWFRHQVGYTAAASANHRVYVVRGDAADTSYFYVDGAQVEAKPAMTTYCDGTQAGCAWAGVAHDSTSSRSAQSRSGGVWRDLEDDFGFYAWGKMGTGAPPIENYYTQYSAIPGALWEHTRIGARVFTIQGGLIGSDLADLHGKRAALYAALKPDSINQEPVMLRYYGAAAPQEIAAYYDGGMEGGIQQGFSERIALRFIAPEPNWRGVLE